MRWAVNTLSIVYKKYRQVWHRPIFLIFTVGESTIGGGGPPYGQVVKDHIITIFYEKGPFNRYF